MMATEGLRWPAPYFFYAEGRRFDSCRVRQHGGHFVAFDPTIGARDFALCRHVVATSGKLALADWAIGRRVSGRDVAGPRPNLAHLDVANGRYSTSSGPVLLASEKDGPGRCRQARCQISQQHAVLLPLPTGPRITPHEGIGDVRIAEDRGRPVVDGLTHPGRDPAAPTGSGTC